MNPGSPVVVAWYRNATGWQHCAWEPRMMSKLASRWAYDSFPVRRSFDLILAITLKEHGVEVFHTRNTKDFEDLNYFRVVNPLA
jgi:predicted nucleic acid-binding protein